MRLRGEARALSRGGGLPNVPQKDKIRAMKAPKKWSGSPLRCLLLPLVLLLTANAFADPITKTSAAKIPRSQQSKQSVRQDDSLNVKRASDLALRPGGERKAGALTHFVEGMVFEENGEMDRALEAYRKVLKQLGHSYPSSAAPSSAKTRLNLAVRQFEGQDRRGMASMQPL